MTKDVDECGSNDKYNPHMLPLSKTLQNIGENGVRLYSWNGVAVREISVAILNHLKHLNFESYGQPECVRNRS